MALDLPDSVHAMPMNLPEHFVTEPPGSLRLRLAGVVLIVVMLALLGTLAQPRYIAPDILLLLNVAAVGLGVGGIATLYSSCRRHELWLDSVNGRYWARWNTLSTGRNGLISEFAGVSIKDSINTGKREVWIAWRSFDVNPLRIVAADETAATLTHQRLADLIVATQAASPDNDNNKAYVPRSQSTRKDDPSTQLWGGLFFLVIVLPLFSFGLHTVRLQDAIVNEGREILGSVTGHRRERTKSGYSYYLSYKFAVEGKTYYGESIVLSGTFHQAEYQSPIPVEYLPSDPDANRLREATRGNAIPLLIMGPAFGAIALLAVTTGYRQLRAPYPAAVI